MRWVLRNDKVIIAILLPVVMDSDKKLKYILAHDKQQCTNVRWVMHNDKDIIALPLPIVVDIDKMLKCI